MSIGYYPVDTKLADRNVQPFARAFKGGHGKIRTFSSGRVDMKAIARKSMEGYFKRPKPNEEGIPTVTVIVDCSGSMSGSPMDGAVQLCAIMSRLHQRKLINANILCTGYTSSRRENGFKVPLPQPDWVWSCLSASHNYEGISQTFRTFMDDVTKSDLVTCYTDANIQDEALEPTLWRKHGVSCIGLYVGYQKQQEVLANYFDKSIVRESVQDLFTSYLSIVGHVLRRKFKS